MVTEHPQDTGLFCPIDSCNAGPYSFDLLSIHVGSHSFATRTSSLSVAGLRYERFEGYPSVCPVKNCGTKLASTGRLGLHLTSHDTNTRCNNRAEIRGAGYDEVTGHPLCPICGLGITRETSEKIHIEELGPSIYLSYVSAHMFRCHWHEPEMLQKHRRDILKIDGYFGRR